MASSGGSLIDLGNLSKPATRLIDRISDAVGVLYEPKRIQRQAEAEAEARKIQAQADMEISHMQQRGLRRFIQEEGKNQENMERIGAEATKHIDPERATPEEIDEDWIRFFFENCRITSNSEMQKVWSRILAGEANAPGLFSKRTISVVSTVKQEEARLFTNFCSCVWRINGYKWPIIDEPRDLERFLDCSMKDIYILNDAGLVLHGEPFGYGETRINEYCEFKYFDRKFVFRFDKFHKIVSTGMVKLTEAGAELFEICEVNPDYDFMHKCIEVWNCEEDVELLSEL